MKALKNLLMRLHRNEKGAVSIETVLIIAAIAIPVLFVLYKVFWLRIQTFFSTGMNKLEGDVQTDMGTGTATTTTD